MNFQITTSLNERAPTVSVSGDIDLATADEFRLALDSAYRADNHVHVDLSQVTFMDSTGINALLRMRRSSGEVSGVVRLTAASSQVQRLLELTGVDGLFPIGQCPCVGGHPAPVAEPG
jgi:anti-anti-sigma factor